MGGMQALDSTEEPIPAAVKAVLKAKVELLVRKVTTQQKAAAAAKQVLCRCQQWLDTHAAASCAVQHAMSAQACKLGSCAKALACSVLNAIVDRSA